MKLKPRNFSTMARVCQPDFPLSLIRESDLFSSHDCRSDFRISVLVIITVRVSLLIQVTFARFIVTHTTRRTNILRSNNRERIFKFSPHNVRVAPRLSRATRAQGQQNLIKVRLARLRRQRSTRSDTARTARARSGPNGPASFSPPLAGSPPYFGSIVLPVPASIRAVGVVVGGCAG